MSINPKVKTLMNAFVWGLLAAFGAIVAYVIAVKVGLL